MEQIQNEYGSVPLEDTAGQAAFVKEAIARVAAMDPAKVHAYLFVAILEDDDTEKGESLIHREVGGVTDMRTALLLHALECVNLCNNRDDEEQQNGTA